MANVSFANLDRNFDMSDPAFTAFSAISPNAGFASYSFVSTGNDDWEFGGTGIADDGAIPTAGTVTRLGVDLDDENDALLEIDITNIADVSILDFGINAGTADQQNNSFWEAALGGADTFDFTFADLSIDVSISGDGADIADGQLHVGANDSFVHGGNLTGTAKAIGDYDTIADGIGVGGSDIFTVGGFAILGDFEIIAVGGTGIGGNDVITPVSFDRTSGSIILNGDANVTNGSLFGGDDLIDLRGTDISAVNAAIEWFIIGDTNSVGANGALIGGDDTIYGSSQGEFIAGDYNTLSGYAEGGDDSLVGGGGADTIEGDGGDDTLEGGAGMDRLFGEDGDDLVRGGAGADSLSGFEGLDTLEGGTGRDTLFGGRFSDDLRGGADNDSLQAGNNGDFARGDDGDDTVNGGNGSDFVAGNDGDDLVIGGKGFDTLGGGAGNDTLVGGNADDTLSGGGGDDQFNFNFGNDEDLIQDFTAGAGSQDVIRLSGFGANFDTFTEVLAAASQQGSNTLIDFGGGDTITLMNVTVGNLHQDDFIFG